MNSACCSTPLAIEPPLNEVDQTLLSLPSIHCASCIGKVERALRALPGVHAARVNLSLRRVAVESELPTEKLVDCLASVGFKAHPLNAATLVEVQEGKSKDLLMRLAVAGFALMNVMLLSVAVWSGASDATRDLFHLTSAMISFPVIAYSAQPFFKNAMSALRGRSLNMDVPISLAIILAALMSLYETLNNGAHAYFDAALSLTFFLLVGRYLEQRTRGAAMSAAKELAALESQTAQKLHCGKVETVEIESLQLGDEILIPTGVRVPVDGRLRSATAVTDRSFITGETKPISYDMGQELVAGEINLAAPFKLTVTAVGEDTTLRRIAALVETAENAKNSYTNLADRAARIYAPAVHLLALFAFLGWMAFEGDLRHALNISIAVLIITCPCALGLAVPAVASAAIGKLYQLGFLVKSGTALERLAEVDTAVFDKTGTLTRPVAMLAVEKLGTLERSVALSLAQSSQHPWAQAVQLALNNETPVTLKEIEEIAGKGIQAKFEDRLVQLGRGDWIGSESRGLGLRYGEKTIAIETTEQLRDGAEEALSGFEGLGMKSALLSGDDREAVEAVAHKLSISEWYAGTPAVQKHELLQSMSDQGRKTVMLGDGLNDAVSLAAAHASIAPASALDAARTAADVVVLRESFQDLPLLIRVARLSTRLARQNFALASVYNAIAVPIALAGYATPLLAALAMSLSSLTVLLNALRIRIAK